MTVQGNVATQATRNRMLAALPYPETKMVLDNMPLPNHAGQRRHRPVHGRQDA